MCVYACALSPPTAHTLLQVLVEPAFGIYAFTLAAMLSLVLSHFMCHLHRDCVARSTPSPGPCTPVGLSPMPDAAAHKQVLYRQQGGLQHSQSLTHSPGRVQVRLRYHGVTVLLVAAYACVLVGQVVPCFTMTYTGLVGSLLETKSTAAFSLLANGLALPRSCVDHGAYFLMVTFLTFTLVVPLAQLVLFGVLWLAPLSRKQQATLMVVLDVMGAWSGLDVYLVAIVAAVWEIGKLSQQIIGSKCSIVDQVWAALP